jgi:hypothetical protein
METKSFKTISEHTYVDNLFSSEAVTCQALAAHACNPSYLGG